MVATVTFGILDDLLGHTFGANGLVNATVTQINGTVTTSTASPNELVTYSGLTATIGSEFIPIKAMAFEVVAVSDTDNTLTIDAYDGTRLIAEMDFSVAGFSSAGIVLAAMPLPSLVMQANNLAGLAGSLFVLGMNSNGARTQSMNFTVGAAYSFIADAGVHYATVTSPVLQGFHGPQMLIALSGNDTLVAGGGRTVIYGGPGNDLLVAGTGKDLIYGGAGNDTIVGGSGINLLFGGSGTDTIYAGTGRSIVISTTGADRFVFSPGHTGGPDMETADSIQHFRPSHGDLIDLTAFDALLPANAGGHLTFIGTNPFDGHAGELRYDVTSSGLAFEGDLTGTGNADFLITMKNTFVLATNNFLL